ncbi:mitochondrial cardiolipin hydrolase-like [Adelges cooleyi]|uniref:mitochondrial cardiolipin hydrolase-like n=1 Tax=Adelges cooleyi TaxID=133065 RepID=UPI00218014E1|nr:mitochondrial cardiolipin hydrolase-like [Adelges cooleyi]
MDVSVLLPKIALSLGIGITFGVWLHKYLHRDQTETLFFFGNTQYYHHTTNDQNDCDCRTCKSNTLIKWLNQAKHSLDICLCFITDETLTTTIIDAHKRGIKVRIILDEDCIRTTWKMGMAGIAKKVKKAKNSDSIMHHKFTIIDGKKVILGSLNWTPKALRKNWENTLITNNAEVVRAYSKEFEKLWKQF